MPDSFGKRQRRDVKARKAAAREQRRVARNRRRTDRAAGLHVEPPGIGVEEEPGFDDAAPPDRPVDEAVAGDDRPEAEETA